MTTRFVTRVKGECMVEQLKAWMMVVMDSWVGDWVIPIGVALLFFALIRPLRALVFSIIRKLMKNRQAEFEHLKSTFSRPSTLLVLSAGVYLALWLSPAVHETPAVWVMVVKIFRSLFIVFGAWFACILEGVDGPFLGPIARRLEVDKVLMPFVAKLLRFITIAVAALIIVQEWGYSISGLLTGLGLGGLAVALAAQDMLSNLFAGAMILLDKPFGIGDWISSGDIEGTVEDVNFRSVKIRTFTQAVVTVPNAALANSPVTNFSRMGKRRVLFNLTLSFDTTPEQMKRCSTRITSLLHKREDIDKETIAAVFDSIGDSRLNLMVVYYTKATDWLSFIEVRGQVYYEILDALKDEGVPLAQPTQTVFVREGQE